MALIATSTSSVIPQDRDMVDLATLKTQMVRHGVKNISRRGLNTIEIKTSSDAFINLSKSKLILTCRIKTAAGADLVYDPLAQVPQYSDVSVVNSFLHSVFSSFSVFTNTNKNEVLYHSVHGNFGLYNYIKALRKQQKKLTFKRTDGFSVDTTGPEITSMHGGNAGLNDRGSRFFGSRLVCFSGDLGFPIAEEQVLLPPGLGLFIEAEFASDILNLLIPAALPNDANDIHYKLEIASLEVDLCETYLRPQAFLGYTDVLSTQDFTRFFTDHEIKVFILDYIIKAILIKIYLSPYCQR